MSHEQDITPIPMSDEKDQVPTPNMAESNVGESNVGGSQDISMNIEISAIPNESQSSMPNEMEANRRKQTSDQGTTHLRNHFKSCKLRTTRDIRQAFLKTEKKGSETNLVGCFAFNQELARSALAKMIVAHEYPMAMVEHKFFKEFLSIVAPLFKGVTRNTIRSDIMKIYNEERENTMKLLSRNQGQIAITTYMWTSSNQNLGYMTVTSHFIDDSWTLQSRIVRFIYMPAPHTSEVLANVLSQCLLDWNLDRKLSTLTVDNCTTNDAMIELLVDKLLPSPVIHKMSSCMIAKFDKYWGLINGVMAIGTVLDPR
ncbi:Ribonuclease H-like superfamily [Sesbania bispinosa]|nr:Ribonuclease H-like superfamily [Sesbania bispinosa]